MKGLLPGCADWQVVSPDGLPSRTSAPCCGSTTVPCSTCNRRACATAARGPQRLGRGEDVDASEYTFEPARRSRPQSRELAWLNRASSPRRRPPAGKRDLRDVPRRVTSPPEPQRWRSSPARRKDRSRDRVDSSGGYRVRDLLSISPTDAADVHTVQGDISQPETAQRNIEETLDRFGRIDADQQRGDLHRQKVRRCTSTGACGPRARYRPGHPRARRGTRVRR